MERNRLIELVTAAQKGDSTAMDELFSAFYNDVYYFALKTLKDSDTACDITQETFLEIINTIGDLQEPAAFVTWMKQITYHQCTRYFKKKKDVLVEEDEDGNSIFDTLADESENSIPAEIYEKADFRNTILGIINELSEEQRSAVMMYYFDELTVSQIAEIQGVTDGTVKSRLNYARKAIKKSVESYEKKNNIKLHSIAFLPLFMLFFAKEAMPTDKAAKVQDVVSKAAGRCGSGSASAAGIQAGKTGLFAKLAGLPLATKIIACVVAAGMVIGGGITVIVASGHNCQDDNRDCICDDCQQTFHQGNGLGHEDFCTVCGLSLGFIDEDGNGLCDTCGENPCEAFHHAAHTMADGICAVCGFMENPHVDAEGDGYCDHCGEAMCVLEQAEHFFPEGECLCLFCGFGTHAEGDVHPFCGVCRKRLPLDDRDGDGACDTCGEYSCGSQYHDGTHADDDGDGQCDICKKYMCGLVWGLEHTVDYSDGVYDNRCDHCGGHIGGAIGWADEDLPHADENADGICECCNRRVCEIYGMPEFGGTDADGDKKCDVCGFYLCVGHSYFHAHYDLDHDDVCDHCHMHLCAFQYLPHTDNNADRICDKCFSGIY